MQLQLRPDPKDRRTMYLTDARGRMLPGQTAVRWSHGGQDEIPEAVVTFFIDGHKIAVVADPVETGDGTLPEALEAFGRLSDVNRFRFIEAVRPHPHHRSFQRINAALNDLAAAFRL